MDVEIITRYDDGKGRSFVDEIIEKDAVQLRLKEDAENVTEAGDYAYDNLAEFEMIVLLCPFCGFEAPLPWLIKIVGKEPLTIAQELFCKKCDVFFHVIEGRAYRSWLSMETLKKCLK